MKPIPSKLRRELSEDPYYKTCIHAKNPFATPCEGRITYEHALKYAGEQIQEKWAIVPCCWKHNVGVSGRDKKYNQLIALERATPEDLAKYPKVDWEQEKIRLAFALLPF